MTLYHSTIATRFGPFSLAVDEDGAVIATAFGNLRALRRRIPAAWAAAACVEDAVRTAQARAEIRRYAETGLARFSVPVRPLGTPFQQRVWTALREIPWGRTSTYGAIAQSLRSSPRAVGRANATNPICLLIPCHRVIGADGSLTGFAFGETVKRQLLAHEAGRQP